MLCCMTSGAAGVIVDTSAIIAILATDDARPTPTLANADVRGLSAASYLECGIVMTPSVIGHQQSTG